MFPAATGKTAKFFWQQCGQMMMPCNGPQQICWQTEVLFSKLSGGGWVYCSKLRVMTRVIP